MNATNNLTSVAEQSDCSVLIVSCDRYADVWRPFFTLFWRYWPDCPYPVFLGANTTRWDDPRVQMILVGEDKSWAENARAMLSRVPTQYVLVSLEDFLITERVNSAHIASLLCALDALNGAYLRFYPAPMPDKRIPGYPSIGLIERGAPYRVSLHMALWRRDDLLELLRNGETAWDMEIYGSIRSNALTRPFFSTWADAIQYDKGGVNKGKWTPSAIRTAQRQGVCLDFDARPRYSRLDSAYRMGMGMLAFLINRIPWRARARLGAVLRDVGLLSPKVGTEK